MTGHALLDHLNRRGLLLTILNVNAPQGMPMKRSPRERRAKVNPTLSRSGGVDARSLWRLASLPNKLSGRTFGTLYVIFYMRVIFASARVFGVFPPAMKSFGDRTVVGKCHKALIGNEWFSSKTPTKVAAEFFFFLSDRSSVPT